MKTFRKNVLALIFCNAIISIVGLFSGSFLVAYFYSSTSNYILTIGIYYLFLYAFIGAGFVLLGKVLVNAKYRDLIFKTGIVIKCIYVLCIVLFKNEISNHIIMLGVLCGVGDAFYWSGFHVIKNDIISENAVFRSYTYYATIIGKAINISVPVLLGALIEYSSFLNLSIYILILCMIALALSFGIKSGKFKDESFCLKKYLVKIQTNKRAARQLKYLYIGIFSAGMRTIVGTLTTIVIMMTFGTNISIGVLSSVMTVCTFVFLYFYNRFERVKKSKIIFYFVLFAPLLSSMLLMSTMGKITLIIFNLIYSLACTTLDYSLDINRYAIIKKLRLGSDIVEHHVFSEILISIARLTAFGLFTLIGLLNSLTLLKILFVLIIVFVGIQAFAMKKLQLKFNERKSHKSTKVLHKPAKNSPLSKVIENSENLSTETLPEQNALEQSEPKAFEQTASETFEQPEPENTQV